jgi:hypothetical protein
MDLRVPLKFHVGECLTAPVPDDEAGVGLVDRPGRREAAGIINHGLKIAKRPPGVAKPEAAKIATAGQ